MYLAQAFKVKHDFWRYIVGSIAVIGVNFVAQIPFIIAIVFKDGFSGLSVTDQGDLLSILDSNTTLFLILLPFAASLILGSWAGFELKRTKERLEEETGDRD